MFSEPVSGPIPIRPIRDSIRELLARRIIAGELAPGAQPTIQELVSDLGASATPVREALLELTARGLVVALPNRGFRVRDLSAGEVEEIYPLIALLEVEALTTSPPSEATLARLDEINARFRDCVDRPLDSVRVDTEWHTTLLEDCRNATLQRYLGELRTRACRYEVAYLSERGRSERSADLHDTVVEAARSGDLARASAALRENWMDGPNYLVPWIERRTQPR